MIELDLDKKRPIQEVSAVLQGEGKLAGVPHLLIRFSGCKLRCQFANSFCDTWYASWSPEKGSYTLNDVIDFIEDHKHIKHIFITGGGPTLQGNFLSDVVDLCRSLGLYVTIEVEGSQYVETNSDLLSLSPKLSNSTPIPGTKRPWDGKLVTERDRDNHEKWRVNYTAMNQLINNQIEKGLDYQLKPVISSKSDLEEFKELQEILEVPNDMCYLMPEGDTEEKLQNSREWLFDICIKQGYNYTDRLHIIVYGDRRGV